MPPCVSAVNFADLTQLEYGRPFTQIVKDETVASTGDGAFSSGANNTTTLINHDVTYTNSTGAALLVTPVFIRPARAIYTTPPQSAWLQEIWAQTVGNPAGAPSLPGFITQMGGGSPTTGMGSAKYWYHNQPGASYAPLGQTLLQPGFQLRVHYRCNRVTNGSSGSSNRYAYARNHRIVFLADLTTDPAV